MKDKEKKKKGNRGSPGRRRGWEEGWRAAAPKPQVARSRRTSPTAAAESSSDLQRERTTINDATPSCFCRAYITLSIFSLNGWSNSFWLHTRSFNRKLKASVSCRERHLKILNNDLKSSSFQTNHDVTSRGQCFIRVQNQLAVSHQNEFVIKFN